MIDLLNLQVYIKHDPFGNKRLTVREDAEQTKDKQFSKKISFNPAGSPVYATSIFEGQAIGIRCSPIKVLQGHNVFGTSNVCYLAVSIICGTLDRLKIKYTDEQREAWRAGDFKIKAIDITHRFCLPDGLTSFEVFQHQLRTSPVKLCKPRWLDQGTGIRLCTENSGLEWLFYDKEQELRDKRKHAFLNLKAVVGSDATAVWRALREIAESTIRAELKLSYDYLKRHKLTDGHAWTAKSARLLYFSELQGLPGEAPVSLNRALARVRAKPLRITLLLWSTGHDLRREFPPSTLRHHRQAIKVLTGIDIDKHVPTPSSVTLSQIFCRENAHLLPDKLVFGAAAFLPAPQKLRNPATPDAALSTNPIRQYPRPPRAFRCCPPTR